MAASPAQILLLRNWIGELNDADPYTDEQLAATIERYPKMDARGVEPYWWDTSTTPPTQTATTGWIPSYDTHAAAEEIFLAKAGRTANKIDRGVERPQPNQVRHSLEHEQYKKMARYHAARRSPSTITLIASPSPYSRGDTWVINLPEAE